MVQNLDRDATASGLLIDHFQQKANLVALLSSYTEQTQEIENTLFDLLNGFWIDTAAGAQLDGLGEIVGAVRNGADDATYRLRIRVRIILNKTSGTTNQIIQIMKFIIAGVAFSSAITFSFTPQYPAAFLMEFSSTLDNITEALATEIGLAMIEATPAGVRSSLIYSTSPDDASFTFAVGSSSEADTGRGFTNLSFTSGGNWAGLISNKL